MWARHFKTSVHSMNQDCLWLPESQQSISNFPMILNRLQSLSPKSQTRVSVNASEQCGVSSTDVHKTPDLPAVWPIMQFSARRCSHLPPLFSSNDSENRLLRMVSGSDPQSGWYSCVYAQQLVHDPLSRILTFLGLPSGEMPNVNYRRVSILASHPLASKCPDLNYRRVSILAPHLLASL